MGNLLEKLRRKPQEKKQIEASIVDYIEKGTLTRPMVEFDSNGVRQQMTLNGLTEETTPDFILKPAENGKRDQLLKDCSQHLTKDQMSKLSYNQFIGDMIQLLGGRKKGIGRYAEIVSEPLNMPNGDKVEFSLGTGWGEGFSVISNNIKETIRRDREEKNTPFFIWTSISVDKTFYSPVSGKIENTPSGDDFDESGVNQGEITLHRVDDGREVISFLRKTVVALAHTQKA